ncbi:MAG: hypothetical protein QXX09_04545 [Candidatus Methanomethylicia archaeon]
MSRLILEQILRELNITLGLKEFEELYKELTLYFGIVGAIDECKALENAWNDPIIKQEIVEFIKAWVKRRKLKVSRPEAITIL